MTKLEDLEERFGISFGETEFETLNGYIISKLEHIPDENEDFEVQVGEYNFKIAKVEKNVIQSVLVTRVSHDEQSKSIEDQTQ
jgi:putative hemolysin